MKLKHWTGFDPADLEMWKSRRERYRQYLCIVEGIVAYEELAGPDGMNYFLCPDPGHTKADVEKAAQKLLRDQDVVGLFVIWIEGEPQ